MTVCPDCGKDYENLSIHWAKSGLTETQTGILDMAEDMPEATDTEIAEILGHSQSYVSETLRKDHNTCTAPELTDKQRQATVGLVMGDGWLTKSRNGIASGLKIANTNRRFLEWVGDLFGILSCGVRRSETGSEIAESMRESGFYEPADDSGFSDVYSLAIRNHPVFAEMRAEWYGGGGLRYPDSVRLTPMSAKMWYCSDGGISWSSENYAHAVVASQNESGRGDFLSALFEEHGFSPVYSEPLIRFSTSETPDFLRWMGEPPSGFEYKWECDIRGNYDELKQKSKSQ